MKIPSLLKQIFLVPEKYCIVSNPKNLSKHYQNELGYMYFDEVCMGGEYTILEKKIERYKYHSDRHISTELVEILSKCVEVSKIYHESPQWTVVAAPMHWTRYVLRGFDHIHRLAVEFSEQNNLPYSSLLGTTWTKRQSQLSRSLRLLNKKNSFFIKNTYTVPSHIILVDDVVSTGSTLNEAAKVLKTAGAKKVICFTLASNA